MLRKLRRPYTARRAVDRTRTHKCRGRQRRVIAGLLFAYAAPAVINYYCSTRSGGLRRSYLCVYYRYGHLTHTWRPCWDHMWRGVHVIMIIYYYCIQGARDGYWRRQHCTLYRGYRTLGNWLAMYTLEWNIWTLSSRVFCRNPTSVRTRSVSKIWRSIFDSISKLILARDFFFFVFTYRVFWVFFRLLSDSSKHNNIYKKLGLY